MPEHLAPIHVREHGSLLAPCERRALVWLANRMPAWVTSDHLTGLALFAMLGAGLAYWTASRAPVALLFVVVGLAVNWFGDSLDGTLARVRNQQRPRYGFYVDHVVDLLGTFFLLGGLGLSGHMSPLVAMGLLAAYLMTSAEVYLATHACGVFRISMWKIGPTELRILLALGTVFLLFRPWVVLWGHPYRLFDVGGVVAIGGMTVAMLRSTARNTVALYRAEPLTRGASKLPVASAAPRSSATLPAATSPRRSVLRR